MNWQFLKKSKIKNSKKEITKKFNYSTSHKNMFYE